MINYTVFYDQSGTCLGVKKTRDWTLGGSWIELDGQMVHWSVLHKSKDGRHKVIVDSVKSIAEWKENNDIRDYSTNLLGNIGGHKPVARQSAAAQGVAFTQHLSAMQGGCRCCGQQGQ